MDDANSKRRRRDIDILIEISDSKTREVIYAICLENKITDTSISKTDSQLEDELQGLRYYYEETENPPEIYIIYLTPKPSNIATQSFEKLNYDKKIHLYWDCHDNSIFNKLIRIFNDETKGLIDPINDQASYLIRSFLSFIKTDFKSYIEERQEKQEKKDYGIPVIDHLNNYVATLDPAKNYTIKEIKEGFSKHVLKETGMELHQVTRNAHISLSIVNERNRGHYNVQRFDDVRKNIFFYLDNSKKTIKRFNPERDIHIPIYFKSEGEIDCVKLKELDTLQTS